MQNTFALAPSAFPVSALLSLHVDLFKFHCKNNKIRRIGVVVILNTDLFWGDPEQYQDYLQFPQFL